MSTMSIELVGRGVFQKKLMQRISRTIILAARKEGKTGITFGRYSDSPERNGIPCKQFAIVSSTHEELQVVMAKYEPKQVDVTIVLDDTLTKGIESWGWYGTQPINKLTKEGGTLIIVSRKTQEELLKHIHKKKVPYRLAIVDGEKSFSGLWVFKNDHTDAKVLGAVVKAASDLMQLPSLEEAIREELKDESLVESARSSFEDTRIRDVEAGKGGDTFREDFKLLTWRQMGEGVAIKGLAKGGPRKGSDGGYVPVRNEHFKKFTTRTMRPVTNFDTCTKCTFCWLQCPDSNFDVTPDMYYDADMWTCCGCGICEAVCPVEGCITMIDEVVFEDNSSQYELWRKDKKTYKKWLDEKLESKVDVEHRAHGFRNPHQYEKEISHENS